MEDPIPYKKLHSPNPGLNASATQTNPISQGTSYLQFLFKALFFVILVVVLPMFPSQPPEFVSDTIFDKFWELIHLLFIGIAVSYGLFSRRNVEMGVENYSNVENLESYMPRMFDGCENPCGSGEKRVVESWKSQNFVGDNKSSVYFDAQCKPRLLNYDNGIENPYGFKNKNVAQAWNSQYFQGESMVFVAQPDYVVDEFVKPKSVFDDKPLGLPIRSLKSKVRNQDKSDFVKESESSFGSNVAASGRSDWNRNRNYGDLAPINLLEKFNQAMASPSPILQRSSSRKMERGKRVGSATRPSHFRPLSVDEAQFESLKARSFRSTLSFSSDTASSKSSSPEKEYSSLNSSTSEVLNSETVHLGKRKKSSRASSPSGLPLEPTPMNDKVSITGWHSRGHSIGAVYGEVLKKSSDNYLKKELSGSPSARDQCDSGKKEGMGSFNSEKKPASLSKSSSRGKSVRTIRGSRLTTHDKVENNLKMFDSDEAMRKEKMQNGGVNKQCNMPKPASPKYQKEQMQDFFDYVDVRSEEESESESENFEVSLEERVEAAAAAAFCNSVNVVAGADSEVDKKAGEFIAKFRQQIRLQKVASIDRSRGLSLTENRFR
ncbi:uncharacterized protein LOC126801878 [Argentina anserina]|uniref:uncharacterized protein LOC126801878 n=1 Tax=Argentina anserina TaxID=57926 RepID=UPI0021761E24|nr:uncharacterized protein LOC126801878 [Potentilla anserina]